MSPSLGFKRASRTIRSLFHKNRHVEESIQPSRLCELPVELLLEISAFLDAPGLRSLRLTCKFLEDITFPQFCTYLETVKTDLSLASLTACQRLDRLCPYVHSFHVESTRNDILGSDLEWERHDSSDLLVTSQASIQKWHDIIQRLENCQSVSLHQQGLQDVRKATMIRPTPADTITILFSILAAIERPLRELRILFNSPNRTGGNDLDMPCLDESLLQETSRFLTQCCSSLEVLEIKYQMNAEDQADFALQLIQHAARLQRLTVNFDNGLRSERLISRLSRAQLTFELRELVLESGHVDSGHALINFLRFSQQSLVKVTFHAICLDSGDWASILRVLSEFPALTEIHTRVLGEPGWMRKVHFPPLLIDSTVDPVLGTKFSYWAKKRRKGLRTVIVSYCGPGMDIALRKLADYATTDP